MKLAIISQCGNGGKSAIAQAIAVEAENNGLQPGLVDLDHEHRTSLLWGEQRQQQGIEPIIPVRSPKSAREAAVLVGDYDIIIYDCPSRATQATRTIARAADLVLQPVLPGSKKDADLALHTFNQLIADGCPPSHLAFIFTRTASEAELVKTNAYMQAAELGVHFLKTHIPERPGYRAALTDGYAITQTPYLSLNLTAKAAVREILSLLTVQ